ncbi:hypothetical protein [Paenibacillus agilis]|nr:hypothetical protein [Paenibacillus agilis]
MKNKAIKVLYSATLLGLIITILPIVVGGSNGGNVVPYNVGIPWFPK